MSRLSVDQVWASHLSIGASVLHLSPPFLILSLSLSLSVKLESLLRAVSPSIPPSSLLLPPPASSLPAVSMVTSLLIVCSELWLFNFGGVEDENEWSLSFSFCCCCRWEDFPSSAGLCDVIPAVCVFISLQQEILLKPANQTCMLSSWFSSGVVRFCTFLFFWNL